MFINTIHVFTFLFVCSLQLNGVEIEIPHKDAPAGVKEITTYEHKNRGEGYPVSSLSYNRNGDIETKKLYHDNGSLKWDVHYTYGENHRLLEKSAENREGETVWRTTYSYDEGGRVLREVQYDKNDEPEYTKVYEYLDNRTETLMYGPKGSLRWRRTEITHSDRSSKETYYYYPDGNRIKGIITEYDSRGKIVAETHIDEIGAVFRRIETEYDELNRVIGRKVYNHREEIHRRVWIEYLPNGQIEVVRQVLPGENREEEYLFEYNTDKRGAWIYREETLLINPGKDREKIKRTSIESREIEYHPYRSEKTR
ncbi:MAG: hypothetical protein ACLFQW_08730 [Spirochaetaceae bacterium]